MTMREVKKHLKTLSTALRVYCAFPLIQTHFLPSYSSRLPVPPSLAS